MEGLIDLISKLFSPVVQVAIGAISLVGFLLSCILNPEGAVNELACRVIDLIDAFMPRTPDNLKIASLLSQAGGKSVIGYGVVIDVAQMIGAMFAVVVVIKIYKLIPFKAT